MAELLAELLAVFDRRGSCVYCAIAETRGSTPQKAGAAMLVFPDGTQAGTLGGGCVEAEVKRQALQALNDGGATQILSFTLDDDYGWDDGLICGGRMTILAHPLQNTESAAYYRKLHELIHRGTGFTEAVVIGGDLPHGDRYLFDASDTPLTQLARQPHWEKVKAHLTPLSTRPQAATREGIAYLPSLPRVTLLLVGGGHVSQAVAKLAGEVGFEVWVLDDREKFASRQRFPDATRRMVGSIGTTLRDLAPTLTPAVYGIILTRGHAHDEEALLHLAQTQCGYVGMIGSKRKIRLIFEDLLAKGIAQEALDRVHAPLGYNIGSQTVPEIAVSIVAELIARRNLGLTDAARTSWQRERTPR